MIIPKLTKLKLNNCDSVTNDILTQLTNLTNIEITNNNVVLIDTLKCLPNLSHVWFGNGLVTEDQLKLLPNIKKYHVPIVSSDFRYRQSLALIDGSATLRYSL